MKKTNLNCSDWQPQARCRWQWDCGYKYIWFLYILKHKRRFTILPLKKCHGDAFYFGWIIGTCRRKTGKTDLGFGLRGSVRRWLQVPAVTNLKSVPSLVCGSKLNWKCLCFLTFIGNITSSLGNPQHESTQGSRVNKRRLKEQRNFSRFSVLLVPQTGC